VVATPAREVTPNGAAADAEAPYVCPSCGTTLFARCGRCGAIRHTLLPFCGACGDKQDAPAANGPEASSDAARGAPP
jgi:hypothetical protein